MIAQGPTFPLPARLAISLMASAAGLMLAGFVAAHATVAALVLAHASPLGAVDPLAGLSAAAAVLGLASLAVHRRLWTGAR